jgi:hypothetical protein
MADSLLLIEVNDEKTLKTLLGLLGRLSLLA